MFNWIKTQRGTLSAILAGSTAAGLWITAGVLTPLAVAAPSSNTGQDCAARLSDPAPLTTPDREWLERCVSAFTLPTTPSTTAPPTTTIPPVTTPPTSTTPTTTAQPSPTQSCPAFPAFPDASCTGVPVGVTLTSYTGPCTITVANTVIDRKLVNCVLHPMAAGIKITNSRIIGGVYGASCPSPAGPTTCNTPRFSIIDSEVVAPQVGSNSEANGIGENNFTAIRVEVTGGNRGVYCRINCELRDSWIHGTNISPTSNAHASAVRQSAGAVIVHNRLHCSAQDTPQGGGCSADLTGYGDFEPVASNLVQNNLFVATIGGACAYGGSSGDVGGVKPYGNQAHDIRFIDNIFERGSNRLCGAFFPITDFLHDNGSLPPGNVWTGNRWSTGENLPPAS